MKIIVVGDGLVQSSTLEKAALAIDFPGKTNDTKIEIKKFEWFSELDKEQFQEKILEIEKFGPESVPIPTGILEELVDADYLLVHIAPVSKAMIAATTKLKLIGTCRGGLEHIALDAVKDKGIELLHVIRNAEPVADFTLGLILTETRNIARSHNAIMSGKWRKSFSNDLYKTTLVNHVVGLLGLGYIGKLVAKRLLALGVTVIASDPFINQETLNKEGLNIELTTLDDLLSRADVISLHMRLSDETKNMFNKDLINKMKSSAYLINTARAGVLHREDLLEALQNKRIAGAALDVNWVEPIAEKDPILELDNITLTSHIAGDTIDAIPNSPYLLKDVLNAYFETGVSSMKINL